MKLVTYSAAGQRRIGALAEGHVVDLQLGYAAYLEQMGETSAQARGLAGLRIPPDMIRFLRGSDSALDAAHRGLGYALEKGPVMRSADDVAITIPVSEVHLHQPLTPISIICPGPTPLADDGMLEHDEFFLKSGHTAIGPGDPFPYQPAVSEQFYHQVELGIVFGKPGRHIERRDVWDHIVGYTVFVNLLAEEHFQPGWEGTMWHMRYSEGASFDGATIMGPCIVTKDELPDLTQLRLQSWVNGTACEDHLLQGLYRDVATFVSYVSTFITVEPGLLLSSGSPDGPVLYRGEDSDPYVRFPARPGGGLRPGDMLRSSISEIGQLETLVVAQPQTW